ncbi:MAG: hypothetical protein LBR89_03295 [Holosporales bacterium]|nr:hypothetical protein [Holosporales bacterium]
MLHIVYFSIMLSVFCMQNCGAGVAPSVPGVNFHNAQGPSRMQTRGQTRGQSPQLLTRNEAERLEALVLVHGTNAWKKVASELGTRDARKCRAYWNVYLRPQDSQQAPWTDAEDKSLCNLVGIYGQNWRDIVKNLPGRPESCVKNRYFKLLRKPFKAIQPPAQAPDPDPDPDPDLGLGLGLGLGQDPGLDMEDGVILYNFSNELRFW